MKPLRILSLCSLTVALFGIDGCAPLSPAPPPAPWENLPPIVENTMGRLLVDGPNAYVNGALAATGTYIVDGDTVSTGPNTSAIVLLNDGGFVQLDENTDPVFIEGLCKLIKFLIGQAVYKSRQCQQAETPNMAAVLNSLVNVKSTGQETQLTVLEGHVDIKSPVATSVDQYQQYTVESDGTTRIVQLTPEQAFATAAWTRRYFRVQTGTNTEGVTPGQAAAIGVGIGVILDALIGHDSTPSPPPAPPAPLAPPAPPPTTSDSSVQTPPERSGSRQGVPSSPDTSPSLPQPAQPSGGESAPVQTVPRNTDSDSSSGASPSPPPVASPPIR